MKIAVVYSSLTGCTKRVAEAIYNGINVECEKEIHKVNQAFDLSDADYVAIGYWVDKGGPDELSRKFMQDLQGKKVFVFCTLAYYADSKHAYDCISEGVKILEEGGNEVIGNYVANGALAEAMIKRFKTMAENSSQDHHAFTPEKGARYEVLAKHPTKAECDLASERFNERVEIQEKIAKLAQ